MPQPDFQQRIASIEELVHKIEETADPALGTTARELVQSIMDLHGAAIERMLELMRGPDNAEHSLIEKLGRDELVASLLILYGLHPVGLETRLAEGLDKARSRMRAQSGEVELLSIQDGTVRLRLQSNGHGCGSSARSLKELVEEAVYQAAPDITALIIEGPDDKSDEKHGFVPLEMLQGAL